MIDLTKCSKQKDFAAIIGVSGAAVSAMMSRGIILPKQPLADWIIAYCAHLREQAAGRMGNIPSLKSLDLVAERARLAKEQADKLAMQNKITREELVPTALLEEVLAQAASRCSGIFDAIPGLIRRRVPQLTANEIDLIADEIAKARNIVAAMSLANLKENGEQAQKADEETIASEVEIPA